MLWPLHAKKYYGSYREVHVLCNIGFREKKSIVKRFHCKFDYSAPWEGLGVPCSRDLVLASPFLSLRAHHLSKAVVHCVGYEVFEGGGRWWSVAASFFCKLFIQQSCETETDEQKYGLFQRNVRIYLFSLPEWPRMLRWNLWFQSTVEPNHLKFWTAFTWGFFGGVVFGFFASY